MDVTKMESEINPLAIHTSDDTEVPDSKLFSEEGNLLDLHMVRIKEECLDYSYDVTSGMKSEENVEPNSFTMIKCESEEKPCDLDLAKEEVKLEVMTEEDEVFSDRGKKRKRDPNNWRRNLAKLKRNSGRGYVSPITGNEVKEKVFRKVNKCCRKRCFEIINYEEQKDCFTAFWDTGDKLHQDAMLLGYMKNKEKVCQKQKITKERNYVWGYSINVKNDNKRVCRQFLLSLFQISEMRLRTVQNSFKAGGVLEERRGKHANRPNKITENVWQLVKEHWKQIPHQEAHYSRSNTATKYFDNPELNVVKLYNAFKHYFYDKSGEPLKMGYSAYHKYFRKNSEYSFR
ncbi:uncharacterized protein [Periplaneta americana]|uniref:uncharacterized protein isoform X1 n=1 Tax=Periplaneta americana TaxID=6978 RepID=UPI0037E782B2